MTCRATTPMGASFSMVTFSTPVPSNTAIDAAALLQVVAAAAGDIARQPLLESDKRTVRRTTRSGNPSASRMPCTSPELRTK